MLELAMNAKILDIIRVMVFFPNFKKEPKLLRRLKDNKLVQSAIKKINLLKQINNNVIKIQEKSTNYQNKKIKMVSQLKKEDKVKYLYKI